MHIHQLGESDRVELQRILDTDLNALTASDIATLKARRDYLTPDQKKVYEGFLNDGHEEAQSAQAADEEFVAPEAEPTAPRRKRKTASAE